MLTITIQVNDPHPDVQAVKEDLAMYCERFGDLRLVGVEEHSQLERGQMRIWTGTEPDCPW